MLRTEFQARQADAPVVVLFGGNPHRREEVLRHLENLGDLTAYGTLSEEEGMEKLRTLPRVDVVLIGGQYSEAQRARIRAYVAQHLPQAKLSEPGWEYPYANAAIEQDIRAKLGWA